MNLVSTFGASVEKQPEKSALFWGERVYSYRELWTETLLVHSQLQERFNLKRCRDRCVAYRCRFRRPLQGPKNCAADLGVVCGPGPLLAHRVGRCHECRL